MSAWTGSSLAQSKGYVAPHPEDFESLFLDQYWRLNHLYKIVTEKGQVLQYVMNDVQDELYWELWYLTMVLKSRQHGMTTAMCLYALDTCLFNANFHAHIIAHTREDSERIFDEKIKFPYEHLDGDLGAEFEADKDSTRMLKFENGSVISCGQSMRSGTLQFLHISEWGKICAKYPDKAREIRTGSLNTVHAGQMIVGESTAEGREGDFYDYCQEAMRARDEKRALSKLDFKFFFAGWYKDARNVLDPRTVSVDDEHRKYFKDLAAADGIRLTPGQKAWHVTKHRQQKDLMYREHPSSPDEAFQASVEGSYYGKLIIKARKQGRIAENIPFDPAFPVETTWDLGKNDENAIWWHQWIPAYGIHRWLYYYENVSEGLAHYVNKLLDVRDEYGFVYGKHYLPHDIDVSDLSQAKGVTRRDKLHDLHMRNIVVVERVPNIMDGIEAVRQIIPVSQFSRRYCEKGIIRLENYSKEWDEKTGSFKDRPRHNKASNGADAFRQLCQEFVPDVAYKQRKKPRKPGWRGV